MDGPAQASPSSGLDQIRATFAGHTGYEGIVKTLNLHPVSAEEGFVVFEGSPTQAVYNPLGVVHGGYAATLLDTVMGCPVHSSLKAGQGYTTPELKIAYADGKLFDKDGRLCATATTTCLVFSPGGGA